MHKNIMNFSSFINENYTFEDFTAGDMEDVKDLYNEGMTDIKDISRETGLNINTVEQILTVLTKQNKTNESEVFDEHDNENDQKTECDCDICQCIGECNCECCCGNETELLYCKKCGEYIGGIQPSNLCIGCTNK